MTDRPSHPASPRGPGPWGERVVRLTWLAILLAALPTEPPFNLSDPTVVQAGQNLFRQTCTGYCHGAEGRLSRAPALRGREFETGYLYQRIAFGFPPMPAFQTLLTPEDIWKLVAYIKSLQGAKE